MDVPGLNKSDYIHPDSCHCFHIGWGKDMAASSLVLLAKEGCWPGRSLDSRLETAFMQFMQYLNVRHKTTGCDGFSKQDFKMNSSLG